VGSLTASYGLLYRRPPWPFPRVTLLSGLAAVTGLLYGQFKRVQAHVIFVRSLEDRASFFMALENVNKKTGGVGPLGIVTTDTARPPEADTAVPEQTSDNRRAGREEDGQSKDPASTSSSGRWDEIRAASARSVAQSSSWDALRQKHERDRVRGTKDTEK